MLEARKGRVKSLLLDQTRIAGVGNIYADETLFEARIHPETPASSLKPGEVERLYLSMRKILASAVEAGGSTLADAGYRDADGNAGDFQFSHKVYDREGGALPRLRHPCRHEARRRPLEPFLPQVSEEAGPPPAKLKTPRDSAIVRPLSSSAPVAQYG